MVVGDAWQLRCRIHPWLSGQPPVPYDRRLASEPSAVCTAMVSAARDISKVPSCNPIRSDSRSQNRPRKWKVVSTSRNRLVTFTHVSCRLIPGTGTAVPGGQLLQAAPAGAAIHVVDEQRQRRRGQIPDGCTALCAIDPLGCMIAVLLHLLPRRHRFIGQGHSAVRDCPHHPHLCQV